ncbi:M10 family metallopeptidase C-terminal domain-containing protein [Flexibacterium corallicola]|uniref:M10 family metallopeptidase C-terminal domain-containing protein n=1 Tax=Flexibacterium corallicola TaxID=3037259 RepID=UPI00286F7C8A|nr:M10 family metallopeptidase C-terminal domain-containing protein [Pseudovibrio sp. M1P-2-3]
MSYKSPAPSTKSANNFVFEASDAPDSIFTPYHIDVGGTFGGVINSYHDHDFIKITLTEGEVYEISLTATVGNTSPDTSLTLYSQYGNPVASYWEDGINSTSRLVYRAFETAVFYIEAETIWDRGHGAYTLNVNPLEIVDGGIFSSDEISAQLTDGYWNSQGDERASFDVNPGEALTVNLSSLPNNEAYLAQVALEAWTMVTGINFNFVLGTADITFQNTEDGAFFDSAFTGETLTSSVVNISSDWLNFYGSTLDSYSFQTYLHEIGHALGLGHAGNYDGNATYGFDNHYDNDSWQATVMSYFSQEENTNIDASYAYAVTPMIADILAMQELYGVAGNIRVDDTTYGENSTAGGYYDQITNLEQSVTFTILDDGGYDTLDLSSTYADQNISLLDESISDVYGLVGNLSIARGTIIEEVISGSGNDTLIGNVADNSINGGAGEDFMAGGLGNDTYVVNNMGDTIEELAGEGIDHVFSSVTYVLREHSQHLENLTLTGDADVDAIGNGQNNTLIGNSGDNILNGAWGDDTLIGGAGNDTFEDFEGADHMVGGLGSDTYIVNNAGDTIEELAGEGIDHVFSSVTYVLREHSQHLENLTLTGDADVDAIGNGQNNTLIGNSGDNILNGAWGDDTLIGGAGNDTFEDFEGADHMVGGLGSDTYIVNNAGDTIEELAGEGIDHVFSSVTYVLREHSQHLENLTLTGDADVDAIGNGQNNTLIGNAGDNILNGAWGDDTLIGGAGNDTFEDFEGADHMVGGLGNDTYIVNNVGDTIEELAGEGIDHVFSSVTYVLREHSQHLENLTLTGDTDVGAIGNGQNNTLIGNAGDNILNGAWGDDTLIGGAGNDTFEDYEGDDHMVGGLGNDTFYSGIGDDLLEGGNGRDTFIFSKGSGVDTITDFTQGEDLIELDETLFTDFNSLILAAENRGLSTVINLDDEYQIVLEGIQVVDLQSEDFTFV